MAEVVLRTSDWGELLRLAGSFSVRFVKEIDGYNAYQSVFDKTAPLVVYEKK